jgi:hypothetical protein
MYAREQLAINPIIYADVSIAFACSEEPEQVLSEAECLGRFLCGRARCSFRSTDTHTARRAIPQLLPDRATNDAKHADSMGRYAAHASGRMTREAEALKCSPGEANARIHIGNSVAIPIHLHEPIPDVRVNEDTISERVPIVAHPHDRWDLQHGRHRFQRAIAADESAALAYDRQAIDDIGKAGKSK